MPPVMRPSATSIAPFQMIMVMAANIKAMTTAVMIARSRMRFLATANTASVATVKRSASRPCWL